MLLGLIGSGRQSNRSIGDLQVELTEPDHDLGHRAACSMAAGVCEPMRGAPSVRCPRLEPVTFVAVPCFSGVDE